jgi:hypothetical protein
MWMKHCTCSLSVNKLTASCFKESCKVSASNREECKERIGQLINYPTENTVIF